MAERARRALVTGGAVRVGRAVSLALGRAGYDVLVHYHSSREAAEEVTARLEAGGSRAAALGADLRDPKAIEELFRRARRELGGIDLLVNNAGVLVRARPEEVEAVRWDEIFSLNARAPFLCAVAARPLMPDEGGSVVNVADVAAFEAWPSYAPYAASKAALVSLTRSLAAAWAPAVRVNAVAPGAVLLPADSPPEERERAAGRAALERVGEPEDVAGAVLYLDRASYVTGEVIRVDGGQGLTRSAEPGHSA